MNITNKQIRKYRTMEKITRRHLKRFIQSFKSRGEERSVSVIIVHDRIPLFFNYDKRTLPIHPWTYDLVDSAYFVRGELVECRGPNDVTLELVDYNIKIAQNYENQN